MEKTTSGNWWMIKLLESDVNLLLLDFLFLTKKEQ